MKRAVLVAIGSLLFGTACPSTGGSGGGSGGQGQGTIGTGGTGTAAGTGGTGTGTATGGTGTTTGTGGTGTATGGTGAAAGTGGTGTAASTGGNGTAAGTGGTGTGTGGTGVGTGGAGGPGAGGAATGGAPPACQTPIAITTGTAATVTVALSIVRSTVSPDLLGVHTSVYDSAMQAITTPNLLQAAGVKSLRYPGGSYADLYHWETHTGTTTPAAGGGSNMVYIAPGADFGSFVGFLDRVGAKAFITVNYGMNTAGTGPARPQQAAAWVAYANGLPTNATVIGVDTDGVDWQTVGYWAGLRAGPPLAVDDGKNFLRISHPAPVGVKYWEIGNELYGNGYYYASATWPGWEPDLHLAYDPANFLGRIKNAALSPATYGMAVKAFATAMKAVDPTIQIGAIVHWPYTEFTTAQGVIDWNDTVLPQACASADFVVNHWYAGTTLASLTTVPQTDIPAMFSALRTKLTTAASACGAKGAAMPIAITEWGPNTGDGTAQAELKAALVTADPAIHTQLVGIFAAESYANFMEQGALAAHWLELHNKSYLGDGGATSPSDTPVWGYYGEQMAHFLAGGGDMMVQATVPGPGALAGLLRVHASKHLDGSVSVMLSNASPSMTGNVTVNVTGGTTPLHCVGSLYAYTPVGADSSGSVTGQPIFSAASRTSFSVAVPPYSVVVANFPKP